MKIILSLNHTYKHEEHIQFWGPEHFGYTPVLSRAGHYNDDEAAKLNDGLDCIAVDFDFALTLAIPTPFYRPGLQFYDVAGPVIENRRANWMALNNASFGLGRKVLKPKFEVFLGKRRCLAKGRACG